MKLPDSSRQIQSYERSGNSVSAWAFSASRLISSARVLIHQYNLIDIDAIEVGEDVPEEAFVLSSAFFLYGYAIECLLKALWLANGNFLVENGSYIGIKGVGDHKLHELADKMKLSISHSQRDLLVRLSTIITSIGRYPISKNWNETRLRKNNRGGFGPPTATSDSDIKNIEFLILNIDLEINQP